MAETGKTAKARFRRFAMAALMLLFVAAVLVCFYAVARNRYIYTFIDGEEQTLFEGYYLDIPRALREAGLSLGYDDSYSAARAGRSVTVRIRRSVCVTLVIDGVTSIVSTNGSCVRDVLLPAGVDYAGEDLIDCAPGEALYDGMTIKVTTVRYKYDSIKVPVGCRVTYVTNPAAAADVTSVVVNGMCGVDSVIYREKYVGGQLVSRELYGRHTLTEPEDRVIEIGTGEVAGTVILTAAGRVKVLPDSENDTAGANAADMLGPVSADTETVQGDEGGE